MSDDPNNNARIFTPEEMKALKQEFVRVAAENRVKILNIGVWQDAQTEDGGIVSRIPVKDMAAGKADEHLETLRQAGFAPKFHDSTTLGRTIRIKGKDVEKLVRMRRELLATTDWQQRTSGPGIVLKAPEGDERWAYVGAVNNAAASEGMHPAIYQSKKLGMTIVLTDGREIAALDVIQKTCLPEGADPRKSVVKVMKPLKFRKPEVLE